VLGYFGRTPVKPDPEIVRLAEKQLGILAFDGDPLEFIEPGIPKAIKMLEEEGLPITDENIFIVGALATPGGNKGLDFLKGNMSINVRKILKGQKDGQDSGADVQLGKHERKSSATYNVTVAGKTYEVQVQESTVRLDTPNPVPEQAIAESDHIEIKAKLPSIVSSIYFKVGDQVNKGDKIMVLEAMKMETAVVAPRNGIIATIEVEKGEVVKSGHILATLS